MGLFSPASCSDRNSQQIGDTDYCYKSYSAGEGIVMKSGADPEVQFKLPRMKVDGEKLKLKTVDFLEAGNGGFYHALYSGNNRQAQVFFNASGEELYRSHLTASAEVLTNGLLQVTDNNRGVTYYYGQSGVIPTITAAK